MTLSVGMQKVEKFWQNRSNIGYVLQKHDFLKITQVRIFSSKIKLLLQVYFYMVSKNAVKRFLKFWFFLNMYKIMDKIVNNHCPKKMKRTSTNIFNKRWNSTMHRTRQIVKMSEILEITSDISKKIKNSKICSMDF